MKSNVLGGVLAVAGMLIGTGRAGAAPITLQNATATVEQAPLINFGIGTAIDGNFGNGNGWALFDGRFSDQTAVFQSAGPVGPGAFTFDLFHLNEFDFHAIQSFRISVTTSAAPTTVSGALWTELVPLTAVTSDPASSASIFGNTVNVGGGGTDPNTYTVTADSAVAGVTGFRLELFTVSGQLGLPGDSGNIVLTEFSVDLVPVPEASHVLAAALAGLAAAGYARRRCFAAAA